MLKNIYTCTLIIFPLHMILFSLIHIIFNSVILYYIISRIINIILRHISLSYIFLSSDVILVLFKFSRVRCLHAIFPSEFMGLHLRKHFLRKNSNCSQLSVSCLFFQLLCTGPTGSGKTLCISNKLLHGMPQEYMSHFISFSARTSANQTQDMIDSKLDKR